MSVFSNWSYHSPAKNTVPSLATRESSPVPRPGIQGPPKGASWPSSLSLSSSGSPDAPNSSLCPKLLSEPCKWPLTCGTTEGPRTTVPGLLGHWFWALPVMVLWLSFPFVQSHSAFPAWCGHLLGLDFSFHLCLANSYLSSRLAALVPRAGPPYPLFQHLSYRIINVLQFLLGIHTGGGILPGKRRLMGKVN